MRDWQRPRRRARAAHAGRPAEPGAGRARALRPAARRRAGQRRRRRRSSTGTPGSCGCRAGVPAHMSGTLASMGCGDAVRARREAGRARPAGGGAGRRRRDADERRRGADHGGAPLARLGGPALRRPACCNNGDLAEVTWEQREMEGEPRYPVRQGCPPSRSPATRSCSVCAASGSTTRPRSARVGARRSADRPCVHRGRGRPGRPLLPPFLAGAAEARPCARASPGGPARRHTRALLDTYASHEED